MHLLYNMIYNTQKKSFLALGTKSHWSPKTWLLISDAFRERSVDQKQEMSKVDNDFKQDRNWEGL